MVIIIKRSRELIENGISPTFLKSCILEHRKSTVKLDKLDNYYKGNHKILNREKRGNNAPDNKIVNNFPKYITDTVCGYMFGNSVVYSARKEISLEDLMVALKKADINTHDAEIGKDLSVFGVAYELLYMSSDEIPMPKVAVIDPRNAFVVYSDTVEEKPLFGCYYFPKHDESGKTIGFNINVYTDSVIKNYMAKEITENSMFVDETEHFFGDVPMVEYWNNEEGMGDFEHVIELIDAYDVLQSDRINDKERFVNAILLIIDATFDEDGAEAENDLKNGILNLPGNSDARYLTKQLNEAETEVLKKAISHDIHKFSQTPDFTDEQFSGNTSGVAIKYKLLSLEYLAKVKERFFTEGLKQRLKLFANILDKKGKKLIDTSEIDITFNRTLPLNELEMAQIIATLSATGIVSNETLLTQLSFVKDTNSELEKVLEQQKQKNTDSIETYNNPIIDKVGL